MTQHHATLPSVLSLTNLSLSATGINVQWFLLSLFCAHLECGTFILSCVSIFGYSFAQQQGQQLHIVSL